MASCPPSTVSAVAFQTATSAADDRAHAFEVHDPPQEELGDDVRADDRADRAADRLGDEARRQDDRVGQEDRDEDDDDERQRAGVHPVRSDEDDQARARERQPDDAEHREVRDQLGRRVLPDRDRQAHDERQRLLAPFLDDRLYGRVHARTRQAGDEHDHSEQEQVQRDRRDDGQHAAEPPDEGRDLHDREVLPHELRDDRAAHDSASGFATAVRKISSRVIRSTAVTVAPLAR